MPCRPSAPISGQSSRGNQSSRSILSASGAMRSAAKLGNAVAQHVGGLAEAEIERLWRIAQHGTEPAWGPLSLSEARQSGKQDCSPPSGVNSRSTGVLLLTLRLEQRLGLAPHSAKTTFVSFTIADPDPAKSIFRPCASPAIDTDTCAVRTAADDDCSSSPSPKICEAHNLFFYRRYYKLLRHRPPDRFPLDLTRLHVRLGTRPDGRHRAGDFRPLRRKRVRRSARHTGHDRRRRKLGGLLQPEMSDQ